MKKIRILIFSMVGALASLLFVITAYIYHDRKFEFIEITSKSVQSKSHSELQSISIAGDSWVAGQKLDHWVLQELQKAGIRASVESFGRPGAKSRRILQDLVANRKLLSGAKYVVVVAGVNDAAGHIGSDFYVHHILLIIDLLRLNGIKPIIVEVPRFGIEDSSTEGMIARCKHSLYRYLFDGGEINVIDRYRNALRREIAEKYQDEAPLVLDPDRYIQDYRSGLYSNPSHLNEAGNQKLGQLISSAVVELSTTVHE